MPPGIGVHSAGQKSPMRGECRAGRNLELRQLSGEERIFGELRGQFRKLGPSDFWLLLTQSSHGQQNLCKRPQVPAVIGGDLELLNAYIFIAVDSSETQEKLLDSDRLPIM